MPKEPTAVVFTCESCGRASTADARMAAHLLPFKRKLPIHEDGTCRHCGGDCWTLTAVFAESGVDLFESAVGLGMAAATGAGFVQHSTASNQLVFPDVAAAAVARMNSTPADRLARVAEYIRFVARARMQQQGGRECASCGALFVPTAELGWHQAGCCSKLCLVQVQGASAITSETPEVAPRRVKGIPARCPAGHSFEAPASFAGMVRPCPECGARTPVAAASTDGKAQ